MEYFTMPHAAVPRRLVDWYLRHRRDLPWRREVTPYRVWVSEIMLQQTRVEAVKPYYERFLRVCPDVAALAATDDDVLLKLWEGLGYYSRVRNMKKCARQLVAEYGGELPADPQALRRLPGIGSYTAGAIASIAFGLPVPAVDGNVLRVLARLTDSHADCTQPRVRREAETVVTALFPPGEASAFTQSLFELGATVCVPGGEAHCADCPVQTLCVARQRGTADSLPCRSAKAPRRTEDRTVLLLCENGRYMLRKRPDRGLLAGLWEFPNLPGVLSPEQAITLARSLGFEPLRIQPLPPAKHIFTHREWHMTAYRCDGFLTDPAVATDAADSAAADPAAVLVTPQELETAYALPSAFAAYKAAAVGAAPSDLRSR